MSVIEALVPTVVLSIAFVAVLVTAFKATDGRHKGE
jgi:hypothetical protein